MNIVKYPPLWIVRTIWKLRLEIESKGKMKSRPGYGFLYFLSVSISLSVKWADNNRTYFTGWRK